MNLQFEFFLNKLMLNWIKLTWTILLIILYSPKTQRDQTVSRSEGGITNLIRGQIMFWGRTYIQILWQFHLLPIKKQTIQFTRPKHSFTPGQKQELMLITSPIKQTMDEHLRYHLFLSTSVQTVWGRRRRRCPNLLQFSHPVCHLLSPRVLQVPRTFRKVGWGEGPCSGTLPDSCTKQSSGTGQDMNPTVTQSDNHYFNSPILTPAKISYSSKSSHMVLPQFDQKPEILLNNCISTHKTNVKWNKTTKIYRAHAVVFQFKLSKVITLLNRNSFKRLRQPDVTIVVRNFK